MWGAFVCGFGIPTIGITVTLIFTGVSFRFGEICNINSKDGLQVYWTPIIAFTAAALVLKLSTMAYCMHLYLRSLFNKSASMMDNSSGLPFYTSSVHTLTAGQAYRRVRGMLRLQWRGVAIVLIILANVTFFAVVFINLDSVVYPNEANMEKAKPWLICLALGGTKKECESDASSLGPNKATLLALVYLTSLVGFWNFALFARPAISAGWLDLFRRSFVRR
jgi:hypothetical protein